MTVFLYALIGFLHTPEFCTELFKRAKNTSQMPILLILWLLVNQTQALGKPICVIPLCRLPLPFLERFDGLFLLLKTVLKIGHLALQLSVFDQYVFQYGLWRNTVVLS